jgi:hypothetical protein
MRRLLNLRVLRRVLVKLISIAQTDPQSYSAFLNAVCDSVRCQNKVEN